MLTNTSLPMTANLDIIHTGPNHKVKVNSFQILATVQCWVIIQVTGAELCSTSISPTHWPAFLQATNKQSDVVHPYGIII